MLNYFQITIIRFCRKLLLYQRPIFETTGVQYNNGIENEIKKRNNKL